MSRVRQGDGKAFEQLYRRHVDRIYAYVWRRAENDALAADLCQDVFVRLWRTRESWEPGGSVAGYLIRIAHRLAIDSHRRRGVRSRFKKETADAPRPTPEEPDDVLERRRISSRVHAAIEALPERTREVFSLKRDAGLTYREIADMLGISPKTVGNHMSTALSRLRQSLADLK